MLLGEKFGGVVYQGEVGDDNIGRKLHKTELLGEGRLESDECDTHLFLR